MYSTPDQGLIGERQEQDGRRDDHHVKTIGAQWKSGKDFFASVEGVDKKDGIGKAGEKSRDKNEQNEEHPGQDVPDPTPFPPTKVNQEPEHATKKCSGEENGKGLGKHLQGYS
jgi:hypothetical protein